MRIIIAGIAVAALLLLAVAGSVLPFLKARAFIEANQNARTGQLTIDQYLANFEQAFKFTSPTGQEEAVYFFENEILQIINQKPEEKVVSRLLEFASSYVDAKSIRHMVMISAMYEVAWRLYNVSAYAEKAEAYYLEIHQRAPKLPQPLYGLFRMYHLSGQQERAQEMGEKIIALWPNDATVKGILEAGGN